MRKRRPPPMTLRARRSWPGWSAPMEMPRQARGRPLPAIRSNCSGKASHTERSVRAGLYTSLDATRSSALLAQLEAALPPIEASRKAALCSLAVLLGRTPEDYPPDLATCRIIRSVDRPLPIAVGMALIRRRPGAWARWSTFRRCGSASVRSSRGPSRTGGSPRRGSRKAMQRRARRWRHLTAASSQLSAKPRRSSAPMPAIWTRMPSSGSRVMRAGGLPRYKPG